MRSALLLFLLLITSRAEAANSTVAALPAASALTGTELFYCVQAAADAKCTISQVGTYFQTLSFPAANLSGTTLNSGVVNSSLTSVGTIGTGVWQGSVIQPAYLATATSTTLGVVKPDNTTISISGGVISAIGGGSVSSVSNSDSTLTISPTTGNVVGSLNLGHANTWTATQTFPTNSIGLAQLANGALQSGVTINNSNWSGTGLANANLANSSTTVAGQTCTLGSSCSIPGSSLSAGALPSSVTVNNGNWSGTALAQSNIATGALPSGITVNNSNWSGTVLAASNGGTGVSNSNTITLGGNLTTTGAGAPTLAFPSSSYTYTFPGNTGTVAELGYAQTWTAAQTFTSAAPQIVLGNGANLGEMQFNGTTSGSALVVAQAIAGTPTLTLPNTTGTFAVGAASPLTLNTSTGNLTCTTCATTTSGGALTATSPMAISSSGIISITGAAGQVLAGGSPSFTNSPTLGTSGATAGSLALYGNTSTGTITLNTAYTGSSNYTASIPSIGTNDVFDMVGTAQTITALKTFGFGDLALKATSGGGTAILNYGGSSSSTTISLPYVGTTDTLATLGAANTFTGVNTFGASDLVIAGGSGTGCVTATSGVLSVTGSACGGGGGGSPGPYTMGAVQTTGATLSANTFYPLNISTSQTFNLPASCSSGAVIHVKDKTGTLSASVVATVSGNGANIDGSSTFSMNTPYQEDAFVCQADASWSIE